MSETTRTGPAGHLSMATRLKAAAILCLIVGLLYGLPAWTLFSANTGWGLATVGWLGAAVAAIGHLALTFRAMAGARRDREATVAFTLLGVIWMLFAWSVIALPVRGLLAVAGVPDPTRSRLIAVGLLVVVAVLSAYGVREAFRIPRVRRAEIMIAGLSAELDGLRVAVLSDTHFDALVRPDWTTRLSRLVNSLDPDVVVHAGDLADGSVAARADAVRPLGQISAPHRLYIAGNHEYYSGVGDWLQFMDELGWQVLRNRHAVISRGSGRLVIAGTDDPTGAGSGSPPDLEAALVGAPAGAPVVLLAHQPSEIPRAVERGVALQISGHTHGGQIWPFALLVRLQQPVVHGLSRHGRTWLWTSRGAGFWGPPFRVFAPSEVSLLTLRSG